MKIGIEAQRIFRPHKHGMDIVALELIRTLQMLDSVNEYFIFVKSDTDQACLTETSNFHIIDVPGKNYVFWEQIMLPIYAKKHKVDVLHCTSNTAPMFLPMPLILTLHDVIFMEEKVGKDTSSNYQKFGNLYRKWLVPKIIKKCKQVITISEVEKANITQVLGLTDNEITVVHNGVSGRFGVKPSAEMLKEVRHQLDLNDDFFLFLGNVEPRKNVTNTVKAFVRFAESNTKVKLVITGLKAAFVENILVEIDKIDFLNRFVFAGFVTESVLLTLYSEAKVFLYPSLREGFGLPILEAMSFGTPVITSNISAMPEVAGDAAFLVNPYSIEEISSALKIAYQNEVLRQEKIKLGYLRPSMFTWENAAKKILNIYQ